jgi:hypothetical protein
VVAPDRVGGASREACEGGEGGSGMPLDLHQLQGEPSCPRISAASSGSSLDESEGASFQGACVRAVGLRASSVPFSFPDLGC